MECYLVEGDCFIILSVLLLNVFVRDELLFSGCNSNFFDIKDTASLPARLWLLTFDL
jgi:hypothetical protein